MPVGLTVSVADPDEDYLGLEIHAASERFAGSTFVFAGLEELSQFADELAGFPKHYRDQRKHEFGSRDPAFAGGYCSLVFHCLDHAGHVSVDITLEDDADRHSPASATLSFATEAAAIDGFVDRLRAMENARSGLATLPGCNG